MPFGEIEVSVALETNNEWMTGCRHRGAKTAAAVFEVKMIIPIRLCAQRTSTVLLWSNVLQQPYDHTAYNQLL